MTTYLAKHTTVGEVIEVSRLRSGTIADALISASLALKLVDLNSKKLAAVLNGATAPFYMTTLTDTSTSYVSNLASVSLVSGVIAIDRVIKVVDSVAGLAKLVNYEEFEQIGNISNIYTSSLFACWEGETVRLRTVGSVTTGDTVIYYYKQPTEVTATTDTPDVPDRYVPLLVDMLTADLIRHATGGTGNAAMDSAVNVELQKIYQSYGIQEATEGSKVKVPK